MSVVMKSNRHAWAGYPPRPVRSVAGGRYAVAVLCVLATALLPALPAAASDTPDFDAMLREIDSLGEFNDQDFSGVYTIVSQAPGQDDEVTQARLFRRDRTDQFVLIILQPRIQRGQGYLRTDDTVYFYDPESRRFERTTLRDSIQGTDAQNRDLVRGSLAEDYRVVDWEVGSLGNYETYILDMEATGTGLDYDRIKLWVRTDRAVVLREENYSVSGRLLRTLLFPRYATVGGRAVPSQILIVDNINEGERTQITLRDPSVSPLPDSVFTRAYLERVNR